MARGTDLRPLHDPGDGVLLAAGFMSGSGTNLRRILEHQKRLESAGGCPFRVAVVFSDSRGGSAVEIGADFGVPVITRDISDWYAERGRPRRDLSIRGEYDEETVRDIGSYGVRCIVYAGYMSLVSDLLLGSYLGLNVHPSDLSIEKDGRRRFTGDHAVRDAILAGERTIRSTTHIVEGTVDGGRILAISAPLEVLVPSGADLSDPAVLRAVEKDNQDRLKQHGDWVIFPATVEGVARGRFAADASGLLHFDGQPIPKGARLG